MKFKESPYYNEDFLKQSLYERIYNNDMVFTIQEFFNIKGTQKEYHVKDKYKDYKLKIYKDYYELNCQDYDEYLYLIFDKPVHITGKYCRNIFAPEIIIISKENKLLSQCIANNIIVHNNHKEHYKIRLSRINNIYFYNSKVNFFLSEINNFFIFNKNLLFYDNLHFLEHHKIKFFGSCNDLKEKLLTNQNFKNGIIHIE